MTDFNIWHIKGVGRPLSALNSSHLVSAYNLARRRLADVMKEGKSTYFWAGYVESLWGECRRRGIDVPDNSHPIPKEKPHEPAR